ncbi:hypothetical protein K469DRAFT_684516 [Zopfia rhizophila CBS 207.26]|uniref:Uncharacterized protein n=1 Tax=Zopfia rhizophila CBS 207.26 TaxID=1314779 RepID=A0A6A6ED48_9PEZI|nr:hypothetical protein K469DRAFT_684516 [Zopfia rhizophila CBS 207.26]
MTSILSSAEKSSPALMSPGRPAYLDWTRLEHKQVVDLTYPSPKVSASKAHRESAVESDRLTDTEVDTYYEDLPTAEQLVADATANRNIANQTHRVEDSRTTSRDEQTNDKNVQTKEILPSSIQVTSAKVNGHVSAIDHGIATSHDIYGKQHEKDPLLDHMQLEVPSLRTEAIERQQCNISSNIQTSMGETIQSVKHHKEMPRQLSVNATSDPDASSEKRSRPEEENLPKRKRLQTQKAKEAGEMSTSFDSIEKEYLSHAYPSYCPDVEWAVNRPVDVHLEDGVAKVTVEWKVTKVLRGECVGEELLNQIDKMGTEKYGEEWQTHSAHRTTRRGPRGAKAKCPRRKVNTERKAPRITARQFSKLG